MYLEHLVNRVLNKAIDLSEDIASTIKVVGAFFYHHPVITGMYLGISMAYETSKRNFDDDVVTTIGLATGSFAYLALTLTKEYLVTPQQFLSHPKPHKTPRNLESIILQHSTPLAAVIAALTTIPFARVWNNEPLEITYTSIWAYALLKNFLHFRTHQHELEQNYYHNPPQTPPLKIVSDTILERPSILAGTAGIPAFIYFYQTFNYGYNHHPFHAFALNTLIAGTAALFAYASGIVLAGAFHSQSRHHTKLRTKIFFYQLRGQYNHVQTLLTELEKHVSDHGKTAIALEKAELTIQQGNYDAGIIQIKETLSPLQPTPKNPLEILFDLTLAPTLTTIASVFNSNPQKQVRAGILCYKNNRHAAADYLLGMAINQQKDNIDYRILRLLFLHATQHESAASRELARVIHHLNPSKFIISSRSTNLIFEYISSALTRTLRVKKNPQNSFKEEYRATNLFSQAVNDSTKIVHPLAHTTVRKTGDENFAGNYLAVAYVPGVPVSHFSEKESFFNPVLQLWSEIIQKTHFYLHHHSYPLPETLGLDYLATFHEKFVTRVAQNDQERKRLFSHGLFIPQYLEKQREYARFIHGNLHDNNIFITAPGHYCFLDFGDACIAEYGLDIEHLAMTFSPHIERLPIYEAQAKIFGNPHFTKQTITRFAYAAVLKAAHLLGRSRSYNEGNSQQHQQNLERALTTLAPLTQDQNAVRCFLDDIKALTMPT